MGGRKEGNSCVQIFFWKDEHLSDLIQLSLPRAWSGSVWVLLVFGPAPSPVWGLSNPVRIMKHGSWVKSYPLQRYRFFSPKTIQEQFILVLEREMDTDYVWFSEKVKGPNSLWNSYPRVSWSLWYSFQGSLRNSLSLPLTHSRIHWVNFGYFWEVVWGWRLRGFGEMGANNRFRIDQKRMFAAMCSPESTVGHPLWQVCKSLWRFTTIFGLMELHFSRKPHFLFKLGVWSITECQLHEGRQSALPPQWGPPCAQSRWHRQVLQIYSLNMRKRKCLPCELPGSISEVDILPQIHRFSSKETKIFSDLLYAVSHHISVMKSVPAIDKN